MGLQLEVNVAQLLKDRVGTTKSIRIDGPELDLDGSGEASAHVRGEVLLTRTDRGIWASGPLAISVDNQCSRCLVTFASWVNVKVDDVFLPSVDIVTGAKARYIDAGDADVHSIDGKHVLDLSDTLRQYRLASLPLAPLCREDCKGICPECGADRNESDCSCEQFQDLRWAKLRELFG